MGFNRWFSVLMVVSAVVLSMACSQPAAPPAPKAEPTAAPKAAAAPANAAPTEAPKAAAPAASKSGYPDKSVNLVVASTAGGGMDTEARQTVENAKSYFPQQFVVIDRPGGSGGTVAAAEIFKAKPDGYNIGYLLVTSMTVEPFMEPSLPFKGPNDFSLVANLLVQPLWLVVKSDAPWKTLKDFIDDGKANPGKIRINHPGFGTYGHFDVEEFQLDTGAKYTQVPGPSPENVVAVLGGHTEAAMAPPSDAVPQMKAGKLRALAIFGERRSPVFPDIPTARELGFNITRSFIHPFVAPKGTPDDVVQTLANAIKKAGEADVFKKYAADQSMDVVIEGPAELKKRVETDYASAGDLVKKLNLTRPK